MMMILMKERSDLMWSDRTQDMSGLSKNEVASDTARHAEHNSTLHTAIPQIR